MPRLPRLQMCPNCMLNYRDLKIVASVTVAKCRNCGQVMCDNCCESSFWSGYICPRCGSKKKDNIGRIKDPTALPVLGEDLEDGRF